MFKRVVFFAAGFCALIFAQSAASAAVFVSTSADRANLRVGPGLDYPINVQLRVRHWPLELLDRYGDWRHVRDHSGDEGWIHKRLVSGKRYVMVQTAPDLTSAQDIALRTIRLYRSAATDSRVVALLQNGVVAQLQSCENNWCRIRLARHHGWVHQAHLWGVGENEFGGGAGE